MIIDYLYNKNTKTFEVSYVKQDGTKGLMKIEGINRFKTYTHDVNGDYVGDDGSRCSLSYTENPNKFDIRKFLKEIPKQDYEKLCYENFPKLYTFDIENAFEKGERADASAARGEILTISICAPSLDTVVLGTRDLDCKEWVEDNFYRYLDSVEFYKTMELPRPKFTYIKFNSEKDLLKFFLERVVATVPVLAGWNSLKYDWQYIVNRIMNNYPDLSIKLSSITKGIKNKKIIDAKTNKDIYLPFPNHTLLVDMMEVIDTDWTVLPLKESLALDYIAGETLGVNKVEYDGDLMDLYNSDYNRFVFYNTIDSILVQLIDYRFRTMDLFYLYSSYCMEKIGNCFSKIALTEALIEDDFDRHNIKIVHKEKEDILRGTLIGAYVKIPRPGKYKFVCCNDFAALYPSTGRTCNISFENFIGAFYDEKALEPYRNDWRYIVVGGDVYKNDVTKADQTKKLGDWVAQFLDEKALEPYRKSKNYFVSVNGHVYDVTKDSCCKRIWDRLTQARNADKYLPKKLDAMVIPDIDHIMNNVSRDFHDYDDEIKDCLKSLGYDIKNGHDILKIKDLKKFRREVARVIQFMYSKEQSKKHLSNSIYGGLSHIANHWFNMYLANDITGEARNLTKLMERHLSTFWQENSIKLTWLHDELGIKVDPEKCKKLLTKDWDPLIYGDTDSLYSEYDTLLKTIVGYEKMTERQLLDIIVGINEKFLNDHNKKYIEDYYNGRNANSVHNFELETVAKSGIWLNCKKHYAQKIMWKDGKFYDEGKYPIKIKGLEIVQSSTPKLARAQLKELVDFLLDNNSDYLIQELNIKMQQLKNEFFNADVEDISGSIKINNYKKYIENDDGPSLKVKKGCSWNVRGAGYYNWLINHYNLPGDNIYGGKVKFYIANGSTNDRDVFFCYLPKNLPKWASKYADINIGLMFERTVLKPFNRILEGINMPILKKDGNIQLNLF